MVHESFEREKRWRLPARLRRSPAHGEARPRGRRRRGAARPAHSLALRRRPLIDEFRDGSHVVPDLSNAFAGRPLFPIGDPKQSIYRFRGVDIRAYLRAVLANLTVASP
ncbi:MAG: UvrD-helicase domain-containing protein [Gemmatimonadetes bacterium]|nr:UvrD-helicase domain-containing protein [Gemmatimonadota bacterium]